MPHTVDAAKGIAKGAAFPDEPQNVEQGMSNGEVIAIFVPSTFCGSLFDILRFKAGTLVGIIGGGCGENWNRLPVGHSLWLLRFSVR